MRADNFQSAIFECVNDARSKRRFWSHDGQVDSFSGGKVCKLGDVSGVDRNTRSDLFNTGVPWRTKKFQRSGGGFSERCEKAVLSSPSANNKYFHIRLLRTFSHGRLRPLQEENYPRRPSIFLKKRLTQPGASYKLHALLAAGP